MAGLRSAGSSVLVGRCLWCASWGVRVGRGACRAKAVAATASHLSSKFYLYVVNRLDRSKHAFEALYERAGRRLLVHLVRRLQDAEAATELWAECWAAAFAAWPRCRAATLAEEEGWLFGIARRQLITYYRTGAIRRRALDRLRWEVPTLTGADELDELERSAELEALKPVLAEALGTLPHKRRRAVELRIMAGQPYAQIAAELAARASVSRGLRRLAELLDHARPVEINPGAPR
jgi:RNA polymerase sigma factor (sigma-70 family)